MLVCLIELGRKTVSDGPGAAVVVEPPDRDGRPQRMLGWRTSGRSTTRVLSSPIETAGGTPTRLQPSPSIHHHLAEPPAHRAHLDSAADALAEGLNVADEPDPIASFVEAF